MFPLLLSPAILTLFQMFSFLHARQIELNEKIKLSWRRYVHLRCITSWWSKFWICIRFFTRTAVLPLSLCVRMRTVLHIKFFFCFQFSSSYIPFAPFLVLLTFWESPFYCSISALLFFFLVCSPPVSRVTRSAALHCSLYPSEIFWHWDPSGHWCWRLAQTQISVPVR